MDPGIDVLRGQEGMVTHPALVPGDGSNANPGQGGRTVHMFTGVELTPQGIERMVSFAQTIREYVGYDIPLSSRSFLPHRC